MSEAEQIAVTMLGLSSRATYAPERVDALLAFGDERPIRATIHMSYRHFKRLRDDGLIEGDTQSARITPLGSEVRSLLVRERQS